MRTKLLKILLVAAALFLLLALVYFQNDAQVHETHTVFSVTGQTVAKESAQSTVQHVRDNMLLYPEDDLSVVTMYLTVGRGNTAENTNHSWEEINSYSVYDYDRMGVERYQIAALLQVGDENGPLAGEIGYGETVPNATVQIRGQSSTRMAQKNYKIELKKARACGMTSAPLP